MTFSPIENSAESKNGLNQNFPKRYIRVVACFRYIDSIGKNSGNFVFGGFGSR